jgi:hypothetical protein
MRRAEQELQKVFIFPLRGWLRGAWCCLPVAGGLLGEQQRLLLVAASS